MIGSVYAVPTPCQTPLPAPRSHCSRPPEPRAERPALHCRFQFSGCQCPHKAVQSANSRTLSSAPREAPYPLAVPPQSSWPQTPDSSNPLAASGFVSQGLSYEWNHSLCILLGLASVTSGMVHPSFLCVVALFLWLITHCVDTEHFVYLLISNGHLTIFHYLDIGTSAALNIAWTRVFSFPGYLPWSGVSGSQNAKFCFLKNRLIPVGLHYYIFLPEANEVSTFSTSLSALVHIFLITAIVISVKWYLIP